MTRSFSLKNHQSLAHLLSDRSLSNLWAFPASHYCATNWHIRKQIKITAKSSTAMGCRSYKTLPTPWTFECLQQQHSALHNNLVVVKYCLQCESSKTSNLLLLLVTEYTIVVSSSSKRFDFGSCAARKTIKQLRGEKWKKLRRCWFCR